MGLFGETFDKNKLKSHLKMAMTRINLIKNKKANLIKLQKRQIADLLQQEKDESARIKVESIIRDDYMIEALEILELMCDLLQTRMQLIVESKKCPDDLKEAISTLIYAAPRIEITELVTVRSQFALKFGKEFTQSAMENKELAVNQRVMFKLGIKVPEPYLCVQYLKEIAREHNIAWDEQKVATSFDNMGTFSPPLQQPQQPAFPNNMIVPPTLLPQQGPTLAGYQATGFDPQQPPSFTMPSVVQQPMQPPVNLAQPPPLQTFVPPPSLDTTAVNNDNSLDMDSPSYDFDELQKRFESLKKRE